MSLSSPQAPVSQPPAGGHLGAEHLIKGSQPFNPSFLSLRFYEAGTDAFGSQTFPFSLVFTGTSSGYL